MSWNLIPWSEQTTNIMATMTYADLIEKLQQLDEKQLKKMLLSMMNTLMKSA